jgi:hypothetical protein
MATEQTDRTKAALRRCVMLRRAASERGDRALRALEDDLAPIEARLREIEQQLQDIRTHREVAARLSERLDAAVAGLTGSLDEVWSRHASGTESAGA